MFSRQSFWGAMWMAKQRRNFQTSTLSAPPQHLEFRKARDDHGDAAPTLVGRMALIDNVLPAELNLEERKTGSFLWSSSHLVRFLHPPKSFKFNRSAGKPTSQASSRIKIWKPHRNHTRKLTNIVWRTDDWKMRSSFEKWCLLWETVPEKKHPKICFLPINLDNRIVLSHDHTQQVPALKRKQVELLGWHYPQQRKNPTPSSKIRGIEMKNHQETDKMKTERGSKGRDGLWTFLGSTLRLVTNAFLLLSVSLFDPSVHLGFRPCPLLGQQSHFLVGVHFQSLFDLRLRWLRM